MTVVYKSEETALRIKMRAKVYGVPVGQMLDDLKLGRNTMSNMKTSRIKADSLARMADYLHGSMDYRCGRTECPQVNRGEELNAAHFLMDEENLDNPPKTR